MAALSQRDRHSSNVRRDNALPNPDIEAALHHTFSYAAKRHKDHGCYRLMRPPLWQLNPSKACDR
jgi:hypothetical protein